MLVDTRVALWYPCRQVGALDPAPSSTGKIHQPYMGRALKRVSEHRLHESRDERRSSSAQSVHDGTLSASPNNSSQIEGTVERIVFAGADSGFTVLRLQETGTPDSTSVVGVFPSVTVGEMLRLQGRWVIDRRFGRQFQAESYESIMPATVAGIERYLGSGLVRGIGPVIAKRLVSKFGADTLRVIDAAPERLREIEGIGPKRTRMITQAWGEQKAIRNVMVFLQSHGVSAAYATKIFRTYGTASLAVLRENPYRLADDIVGIGFKTADRIAQSIGIPPDAAIRVQSGVLYVLSQFTEEGHVFCPRSALISQTCSILAVSQDLVESALERLKNSEKVVLYVKGDEEPAVYLRAMHLCETGTADGLRMIVRVPGKTVQIDVERAIQWVEQHNDIELSPEQKEAVRQSVAARVLVITGGPGTGKTTVLKSLVDIYAKKRLSLCLCAPTGRAAKRLEEATGHDARTIHRLLEYSPKTGRFTRDEQHPLDADIVVVDEMSMVDIALMHHLLKAVPRNASLILVGDVDQLPSVGPGNVLGEIIECGAFPVVRLSTIFRQAARSTIIVNAHRINRGESPLLKPIGTEEDFYFVEKDDPDQVCQAIVEMAARRIPAKFGLDPVNDVQVLSPMHKGPVGVARLNDELQKLLNPGEGGIVRGGHLFKTGSKVMQVRNNYDKEVYNGDIGRISEIEHVQQRVVVAYDARHVEYDFSELDEIVPAYAVSVHKSQGTEFPAVVIPLVTQHYVLLQRNLLYTAVTRATKLAVLVGSKKALAIAIRNNKIAHRYTNLAKRIRAGLG
jgi:exodeoxyribonuclease V alpha subunit